MAYGSGISRKSFLLLVVAQEKESKFLAEPHGNKHFLRCTWSRYQLAQTAAYAEDGHTMLGDSLGDTWKEELGISARGTMEGI